MRPVDEIFQGRIMPLIVTYVVKGGKPENAGKRILNDNVWGVDGVLRQAAALIVLL